MDPPPVPNTIRINCDKQPAAQPRPLPWFLASTLSASIGRNGYYIACAWVLVKAGSGSAGVATLLSIVSVVELVASPLAGSMADRFDRRRLNIVADVGRFAAVIATALSLLHLEILPTLCMSAVAFSICVRVALTAAQATIPLATGGANRATSNSSVFFVMQLGSLGAALLAGPLLSQLSPAPAFATPALFFLVSAGSLSAMRLDPIPQDAARPKSLALTIDPRLRRLFAAYALLYGGAVLVTVLGSSFILEEQNGTAADFGRLEAAWSAGSLIGALLVVSLTRAVGAPILHLMLLGSTALALMSLIALRAPWTLVVFVALGCLYNLGRVSIEVTLQSRVVDSVLGRAKGAMHSLAVALGLLIFSTATVLGDSVFPSTVFFSFGVLLLISIPTLSIGMAQRG